MTLRFLDRTGTRGIVDQITDANGGTRTVPPYDPEWTEQARLDWKAACVELSTGVPVVVRQNKEVITSATPIRGYTLDCPAGWLLGLTFSSAWDVLNGFEMGAKASARFIQNSV